MSRRRIVAFADQRVSLLLGLGCVFAGSLLLHDAYERRGASRPWVLKLLPSA